MKKILMGFFVLSILFFGSKAIAALPTEGDDDQAIIPSSITILSPNGGYTYLVGQKITVKWKSKNIASTEKVAIEIFKLEQDTNKVSDLKTIIKDTLNDGSEIITLDSSLASGSYKIGIKTNKASDFSDKTFTIKGKTIKASLSILSPKKGQVFKAGDKVEVKLKSTGFAPSSRGAIDLGIKDSKGVFIKKFFIADDVDNSGSEFITIPNDVTAGSNYILSYSATDLNKKIQIANSGVFAIAPKNPVITVISPNSDDDSFTAKQKITIKWNSNIDPASYVNIYVSDGKHKGHVSRAKNTGEFSYTLDKILTAGTGYKVYISSVSNKLITDSSNEGFSIKE
jgi:hypothetical protein